MLATQLRAAIEAARLPTALDDIVRAIWKAWPAGALTTDEASELTELIEMRRRSRGNPARSCFPPKRVQRSPDRARSLERRRLLAASGGLPPILASGFTTGEQAALRIVADEARASGACARTLPEIAARAGVSVSTARNAIREAARLGLVTVQERPQHRAPNLANVVRIVSAEWLAWLRRGGGFKKRNPTENQIPNKGKRGGQDRSEGRCEPRGRQFSGGGKNG